MRRLLTLGQPHRNTALQALLQSWRRPLALLVVLVLCLAAFVFAANEAWAKEQPSSKKQPSSPGPPTGEKPTIGIGKPVVDKPTPTPTTPTAPPVSTPPPIETPPTGTLPPPPSEPAPTEPAPTEPSPTKAEPEPAPQPTPAQRPVTIPTTGGESVGPSDEPGWASWRSEPTPTESGSTTEPVSTTTPSESGPLPASATPTTDRGSPQTGIPAAAEEVPAPAVGTPAPVPASNPAPSSKGLVPMIPGLPALQQVAQEAGLLQGAAPQRQAQPVFYSSTTPIVPAAGAAVQPLTRAVTNLVGTGTSAAAKAVAGVLGTVGQWMSDAAPSSGEESSSSSGGATPEPLAPVSPDPFGSTFASLFSGGGQTSSAGGAGATTLLLGVLLLASTLLPRRDFRTYLVSCEVLKPSSALLSPLERPG